MPPEDPARMSVVEQHSYVQILKSSALMGGSSLINIAVGIVRTKAMAVLLGPGGVGLLGMYTSIVDLAQSVAGMGINSSGVRQMAEAGATRDSERIARTAAVLKGTAVALGLAGIALLTLLGKPLSMFSFGTPQHSTDVAILSLAVFFGLVAGAQSALVQGMRRIVDLAKMSVLGSIFGTLISIPAVYFLREDGIVPALVAVAATSAATSWWFSRKVQLRRIAITRPQARREATALLKLGIALMASGFLVTGAAYAVRVFVIRDVGLQSAGLYQSACRLGGLYVGFILQAMGTDFCPRLVAAAADHPMCNRLVNEQAQVSMLLAGPGVIGTLTFAPLLIRIVYTAEFAEATEVLRWICIGMALRVITWPMGYIIVAKGAQILFIATELAWTIVSVVLASLFISRFGLNGAGIAFFLSYIFHALMIYPIVAKLSGFRWSASSCKTGFLFIGSIAIVFCALNLLPAAWTMIVGSAAMMASAMHSARTIRNLITVRELPAPIARLLKRSANFLKIAP